MRLPIVVFTVSLAAAFAAVSAQVSVCEVPVAAKAATRAATPHWVLDHYVYDAALHQHWEVLVDCNHPQTPPRMKPAPGTGKIARSAKRMPATSANDPLRREAVLPAGTTVEVSNRDGAPASIRLSGTAMETAFPGQPIPVRLSANGAIVRAVARGPHSVELIATAKPLWKTP